MLKSWKWMSRNEIYIKSDGCGGSGVQSLSMWGRWKDTVVHVTHCPDNNDLWDKFPLGVIGNASFPQSILICTIMTFYPLILRTPYFYLKSKKTVEFSYSLIAICRKLPSQNSGKHRTQEQWPCKIPKNEDSKVLWLHKNDKQTWGKKGGREGEADFY